MNDNIIFADCYTDNTSLSGRNYRIFIKDVKTIKNLTESMNNYIDTKIDYKNLSNGNLYDLNKMYNKEDSFELLGVDLVINIFVYNNYFKKRISSLSQIVDYSTYHSQLSLINKEETEDYELWYKSNTLLYFRTLRIDSGKLCSDFIDHNISRFEELEDGRKGLLFQLFMLDKPKDVVFSDFKSLLLKYFRFKYIANQIQNKVKLPSENL